MEVVKGIWNGLHTLSAYVAERCSSRSVATVLSFNMTRCVPTIFKCKTFVSMIRLNTTEARVVQASQTLVAHHNPEPFS